MKKISSDVDQKMGPFGGLHRLIRNGRLVVRPGIVHAGHVLVLRGGGRPSGDERKRARPRKIGWFSPGGNLRNGRRRLFWTAPPFTQLPVGRGRSCPARSPCILSIMSLQQQSFMSAIWPGCCSCPLDLHVIGMRHPLAAPARPEQRQRASPRSSSSFLILLSSNEFVRRLQRSTNNQEQSRSPRRRDPRQSSRHRPARSMLRMPRPPRRKSGSPCRTWLVRPCS